MKRIGVMEKQISKIEKKYQKTETAFNNLVDECARLDEILRKNNNPKPEMQLLQAYLQQYEDERVAMKQEIIYSQSQVSNLKDDINNNLYDETQREEYLSSEEKAINTVNAKLDYFLDRFEKQNKMIKNIVKQ